MFDVREETAQAMFEAQKKRARGRLRLDISSRTFPRDVEEPLDVDAARQAIGRRFVEMIEQSAAEAVLLGVDRTGFEPHVVPPPPCDGESLTIMPGKSRFEPFVEHRLVVFFGLDRQSPRYTRAIELLAQDFYDWCQGTDADAVDFTAEKGRVSIACHVEPVGLEPLAEKAALWRARSAE